MHFTITDDFQATHRQNFKDSPLSCDFLTSVILLVLPKEEGLLNFQLTFV
jgi:hypothetical protein